MERQWLAHLSVTGAAEPRVEARCCPSRWPDAVRRCTGRIGHVEGDNNSGLAGAALVGLGALAFGAGPLGGTIGAAIGAVLGGALQRKQAA